MDLLSELTRAVADLRYLQLSALPLPIASGGTGAANALSARAALGLALGVNVQAFSTTLAAFAAYNTNGLIAQTAANNFVGRSVVAGAGLTVTNGDGVAGNPTPAISPAALKSILGATFSSTLAASVTRWIAPYGSTLGTAAENNIAVPFALTARNIVVRLFTAQGAAGSLVFTLFKNDIATSVVLTIPAGAAKGTYMDASNTVAFAAGDLLGFRIVNNHTGTSGLILNITLEVYATP